jgi:hypothetical protein
MSLAVLCVFHALFIPTTFTERLPNLRRISIELNNCTINDFFSRNKFFSFPRQVTHFDLRFSYSPFVSSADLFDMLGSKDPIGLVPGSMPSLRYLSLHGATEVVLNELLWACPNLLAVDTDVVGYDGPHYDDDEIEEVEDIDEDVEAEEERGYQNVENLSGQATHTGKGEDINSGYGNGEDGGRFDVELSTLGAYLVYATRSLPDIKGI